MTNVFQDVVKICSENLLYNKEVLDYIVNERKISLNSINKFELGLFPEDLRNLFDKISPEDLRSAGLIFNSSSSKFQLNNLVMPIRDVYGNYIALVGRSMLGDEERKSKNIVKYYNSVYKKRQHLFGLNFAKNSIIEKDVVYVVEGYFDVISPHQNGFTNVVAVCGSFLTSRQVALLSRYTSNIVMIMDNEPTAQEKAQKFVEKNDFKNINLTFHNPLINEKEKDIDEYLKEHTLDDLISLL